MSDSDSEFDADDDNNGRDTRGSLKPKRLLMEQLKRHRRMCESKLCRTTRQPSFNRVRMLRCIREHSFDKQRYRPIRSTLGSRFKTTRRRNKMDLAKSLHLNQQDNFTMPKVQRTSQKTWHDCTSLKMKVFKYKRTLPWAQIESGMHCES